MKAYSQHSDEALIDLYQKEHDLQILASLFKRYEALIYGVCLKYFKNQENAEDATVEVFELLIKRLPKHNISNFKGWLYRLVSNHCVDILRKQKRKHIEKNTPIPMYSEPSVRPFEEDLKEVHLTKLEACLEKLQQEQKICVDMFYLQEKSYKDIAQALNISWTKTRSYIQNGRRNLKNCMEK